MMSRHWQNSFLLEKTHGFECLPSPRFHGLWKKLPTGAKKEWKKIEGRFQAIDYIEDSKEVYRLLSEIVSSKKPNLEAPTQTKIKEVVKVKLISQWKTLPGATYRPSQKSWPLNPIGLELLPKISGRISQNERTLLRFFLIKNLMKK